jgi:hypothetical protein
MEPYPCQSADQERVINGGRLIKRMIGVVLKMVWGERGIIVGKWEHTSKFSSPKLLAIPHGGEDVIVFDKFSKADQDITVIEDSFDVRL